MKEYLAKGSALLIALSLCAFTRSAYPSNINQILKLESGLGASDWVTFHFIGDPQIRSEVENNSLWSSKKSPGCFYLQSDDFVCTIKVSEEFTHFDAKIGLEVLNTINNCPGNEKVITITSFPGSGSYFIVKRTPGSPYLVFNGTFR